MARNLTSIIMVTHNDQEFVTIAIDSLLRQTHRDFELIVCDMRSDDNTLSIVYAYNDDRIIVVPTELTDYYQAFNRGLALARGVYAVETAATSISHPKRIESLVSSMSANPSAMIGGTQHIYVNREGIYQSHAQYPTDTHMLGLRLLLEDVFQNSGMILRLDNGNVKPLFDARHSDLRRLLCWKYAKKSLILTDTYFYAVRNHARSTTINHESSIDTERYIWNRALRVLPSVSVFHSHVAKYSAPDNEKLNQYIDLLAKIYITSMQRKKPALALAIAWAINRQPGYRREFRHLTTSKRGGVTR